VKLGRERYGNGLVRVVVLTLVGLLSLVACAPGQSQSGSKKTLHILATWGGSEQDSFLAMVKPWEDRTGNKIIYEGSRDLNAILTTRIQAGNPPDLIGIPGPGVMATYAKAGNLKPLDSVVDLSTMKSQYGQTWLDLASVNGKLYGIFIKAALKGPIWYDPKQAKSVGLTTPPKTWDEVMTLSNSIKASGKTPWCVGLENAAASGWPGTDWIEDFMLRQSGPQKYADWYNGKLKWSSPEVKQAWQSWGTIVGDPKMVYGGSKAVLSTAFGDAGNPLFTNPPGCYMHHQASFITDFFVKANPNLKPVDDFNFFPFPDINPQYTGAEEVAGDLFGMLKDSPESRDLIKYLTTPEAQTIWVKRGGALSPNKQVAASAYPDALSKQAGEILTSAKITQFDASDNMPDQMNQAFFKGILDFVSDPSKLDSILASLDKTQADAYKA
jgi:alpha-glucoside transport system substrate-binding protein